MAKRNAHRDKIEGIISDALVGQSIRLNGRDIDILDKKIVNKRTYHDMKEPLNIDVPLTEKIVKLPKNYMLSNIPVYSEDKYMQQYHFSFTNEQLAAMYTCTKIIVDEFHSTFETADGIVHRSSFFAVAPHASVINGIPTLYRLSVTRLAGDESHYTINMHAIAGGVDDGWVFLGRLDFGDQPNMHPVIKSFLTRRFLKQHNAVITDNFTFKQKLIQDKLKVADEEVSKYNYSIPFPHLHQATPHYYIGQQAEKVCPKFLRNCVDNDFAQNLARFMQIFHVSDKPHIRKENENIYAVVKAEKRITCINETPDPKRVLDEIYEMEHSPSKDRFVITTPKSHKDTDRYQAHCLQRRTKYHPKY